MSILPHGCTTWTLTKCKEKKLDGNCMKMLRAILNKSWRRHSTKQQLDGHLPLISKTIQIRRDIVREVKMNSCDVLQWTPSHGRADVRRSAWTYQQQLCAVFAFSLENLPSAIDDRVEWRECRANPCLRHGMMICTNQSLSLKMICIKFPGILRYQQIIQSRLKRKKNL